MFMDVHNNFCGVHTCRKINGIIFNNENYVFVVSHSANAITLKIKMYISMKAIVVCGILPRICRH